MKQVIAALLFVGAAVCLAQDAVKAAPGNYKVIAENESVRVLEANLPAGAKTAMHSHPALLSVMLAPGTVKWTKPDGKSDQAPPGMSRGSVMSMGPDTHVSENFGKEPVRVILVEFKQAAPPAAKAHAAPSVPNCKPVDDAPHATALLCTGSAGSTVPKHTHATQGVYIALTDVNAEVTDAAGNQRMLDMKKDTAAITMPETHTVVNKGGPYELIVVSLK